jgi:hypothetical protein
MTASVGSFQVMHPLSLRLSGADANFYMHELTEKKLMDRGMSYPEAHEAALEAHGASRHSLYSPEVMKQFPEYFNQADRDFWGLP